MKFKSMNSLYQLQCPFIESKKKALYSFYVILLIGFHLLQLELYFFQNVTILQTNKAVSG